MNGCRSCHVTLRGWGAREATPVGSSADQQKPVQKTVQQPIVHIGYPTVTSQYPACVNPLQHPRDSRNSVLIAMSPPATSPSASSASSIAPVGCAGMADATSGGSAAP